MGGDKWQTQWQPKSWHFNLSFLYSQLVCSIVKLVIRSNAFLPVKIRVLLLVPQLKKIPAQISRRHKWPNLLIHIHDKPKTWQFNIWFTLSAIPSTLCTFQALASFLSIVHWLQTEKGFSTQMTNWYPLKWDLTSAHTILQPIKLIRNPCTTTSLFDPYIIIAQ